MDLYYHFDFSGSKEEKTLSFKLLISPSPQCSQNTSTLHGQLALETHDGQTLIAVKIMDYEQGEQQGFLTGPLASHELHGILLGLTLKFCAEEVSDRVEAYLFDRDMPQSIGLVVFLNKTCASRLGLPIGHIDFSQNQGWAAVSSEFINQRSLELSEHYTVKHDPTLIELGPHSRTLH